MKRELTKREKEILKYIGYPREDIAKKLCISVSTVKTHLSSIAHKLKTSSKEQDLIIALKYRLIGIADIDIGFWDSNGIYIEDIQSVDFTRE